MQVGKRGKYLRDTMLRGLSKIAILVKVMSQICMTSFMNEPLSTVLKTTCFVQLDIYTLFYRAAILWTLGPATNIVFVAMEIWWFHMNMEGVLTVIEKARKKSGWASELCLALVSSSIGCVFIASESLFIWNGLNKCLS